MKAEDTILNVEFPPNIQFSFKDSFDLKRLGTTVLEEQIDREREGGKEGER